MEELEKRVKALEVGEKFEATKKDVQELEKEFLGKFQEIREAMVKGGNNAGSAASSKEMEELKKENEALKKRNAKLEYRVQHMLKCMEDLYSKQKQ